MAIKTTESREDWEKRFDKNFSLAFNVGVVPDDITKNNIKDFIRTLLLQQIDEDNKRFLGMIDTVHEKYHVEGYCDICGSGSRSEGMSFYKNQLRQELRDKIKGK